MKVKLVFSYDGSKFSGFQRQNKDRSVQKEIENALFKIYNREIVIKGSGRTDAKVHAYGQVAHFECDNLIKDLKTKLNNTLMPDIVIKNAVKVNDDFHARRSAKKKEYIYKINLGEYKSSLNDYYYQPNFKLDVWLMKEASRIFIGTHDFSNFISGDKENPITTIYSITFNKIFDKLEIRFIGTGFYRYMVRNLTGALIEVGKCKIYPRVIEEMLNNPQIKKSLPTAPAEGLYLNKVWY